MAAARWRRWLLAMLLSTGACSHDLDALRRAATADIDPDAGADAGSASDSTSDSTSDSAAGDGAGDGAGSGDGDSAVGTDAGACEPCEALGKLAEQLGLVACCRGAGALECGVTTAGAAGCARRRVPGHRDAQCPGLQGENVQLEGCCRSDGQCGFSLDAVAVGCVPRELASDASGASFEAIACEPICSDDSDCDGAAERWACLATGDTRGGLCLARCARDADCGAGLVCAVKRDAPGDRNLAVCVPDGGGAAPGSGCASADDCDHGVCARFAGADPTCSQLCVTAADCPWDGARCQGSSLAGQGSTASQDFHICVP